MKKSKIPRYRSQTGVYIADTCQPVREAVAHRSLSLINLAHGHYPGELLPKEVLPGLLTVGHWDAKHPQDWGLDWHRNEGLELTFIRSGTIDFLTQNVSKKLIPNDMTFCTPWQLHRLGNPHIDAGILQCFQIDLNIRNEVHQWSWPRWIILTEDDRDELARLLLYNQMPVYSADTKMIHSWGLLYRAVQENCNFSHISNIAIHINEILLFLLEHLRKPKGSVEHGSLPVLPPPHQVVRNFLDEVKNIPSQLEYPWSVGEMAKMCNMSESRFTKCCHQLTNLTPVNYLNQCRVDLAIKIMRCSPEKSITSIGLECGFSTSQYFATVFKKITGVSPKEYIHTLKAKLKV